jgi:clan AA aspartic protease (TIGR02281 family)
VRYYFQASENTSILFASQRRCAVLLWCRRNVWGKALIRTILALLIVLAAAGCATAPEPSGPPPVNGHGTLRFPNGEVYTGDFLDSRRSGEGTYAWPDGRKYVGTFREGLPNGRGTYTLPNGEQYVGDFQDNRRTGQGVYTWPDGRKYVGAFRDDLPSGQGTYTWRDGKSYVGEFRDGQANGQGVYTWPDGRRYVGELKGNLPYGRGTLTLASGQQQVGEFRNGDFIGTVSVPSAANAKEIPLTRRDGTFLVSVTINGAPPVDFYLDSGSADVSVPAYLFEALKNAGAIRPDDVGGSETYMMANGAPKKSTLFRIRSLKVGSVVLENVRGSVSEYAGPPLLGMSFLGRFGSWSVDNDRSVLVLK